VVFTCSPQTCYDFNWSFYWIYSFTIRVYYKPSLPHPQGKITAPLPGSVIGDRPLITVAASAKAGIKQIEVIGWYTDFDWDGNGVFPGWQYQTRYGTLYHHVGTSTCAPYDIAWNNGWIPDQSDIKLVARITDGTGLTYLTPVVEGLKLERASRSVKMYPAFDVPEKFGVRVGDLMSCKIDIPDDISKAKKARLFVSTWSAAHADYFGLNGKLLAERLGAVHDYSYDNVEIPLNALKTGTNIFYIQAATNHHALEVNWPGPVIMVEFPR